MKKICFVIYDFSVFGGVEKVLSVIANSLSEKYEVHIISICSENNGMAYELDNSIKYCVLSNSKGRIRELAVECFSKLKSYIKRNNIDIVLLMGNYPVPICLPVKPFVKAKFVYCDHGSIANEIEKKDITLFRKLAAKFCDKVVTLTQRNLDDYKKLFGTKQKKLECIYNAIDSKIFDDVSSCYDINSKKIITAGRFTAEKGFLMLVDVANIVLNKLKDWQWDLYGDGEEFEKVKDKVISLNLQDRLILKGMVKDIYKRYKDYSMYVLPSYREGLPLVLLEAKANYLPVVSFDVVTGPREIVNDKKDGFLIPCYDKELMARKICELIENEDLRKEFSMNTYDNIDLFKKETIMNKWINLIENI